MSSSLGHTLRAVYAVGAVTLSATTAASAAVLPTAANPPVLPGDVFNYATKATVTTTIPGSQPTSTVVNSTFSAKATNGASFDHRKDLIKLQFTYSAVPGEVVNDYVGFAAGDGAMEAILYGTVTELSTAAETELITQVYPTGSIEIVYPEAKGQTWSPAAPFTSVGKVTQGAAVTNTSSSVALDGSFTATSDTTEGSFTEDVKETLASNGSGQITLAKTGYNTSTVQFGLPIELSATTYGIPVTVAGGNALPASPTPPFTFPTADWFPSGKSAPSPLSTATIADHGLTTTPAGCGARAGIGAQVLSGTVSEVNTLAGTVVTTTYDQYDAAGMGTVCTLETTTVKTFANTSTGKLASEVKTVSATILTSESGPKPLVARTHPYSTMIRPTSLIRVTPAVPTAF